MAFIVIGGRGRQAILLGFLIAWRMDKVAVCVACEFNKLVILKDDTMLF